MRTRPAIALSAILLSATQSLAQTAPPPDSDANPPAALYHQIGVVTPRSTTQLAAAGLTSLFSIGAEQTDRGFSTYSKWSSYLAPLGIPAARVQTGWGDVEKVRGVYDFSKLDEIYDGMAAVSVKPWFDLQYGNPIYTGGGTTQASGKLPDATTEARAAWLAFVRATVQHFSSGGRVVNEWEIWNEPNIHSITAADYATFAAQTAQQIKAIAPSAKILVGVFSGFPASSYRTTVLNNFNGQKGPTVPSADVQVNYHPYEANPDNSYDIRYDTLLSAVAAKGFTLRQGENGAPSGGGAGALNNLPFNETRQAKWNLRRMLGDFYRGLPSNLFTITDTHMIGVINTKGLLVTVGGASATPPTYGDQTVSRPKVAYGSVRALAAIFDSRVQPLANSGCTAPAGYSVQTYTRLDPGNIVRNAMVVWRTTPPAGTDSAGTGIDASTTDITVSCTAFQFPRFKSNSSLRPRYTDLLPAKVYELLTSGTVVHSTAGVTVSDLRVYDSPVIIADQGIVPIS